MLGKNGAVRSITPGNKVGGNFVPMEAKRTTSFPGKLNELPTSIDEVRTRGLS